MNNWKIHFTTILTVSEEVPLEPIQYWFYSAEKFPRFHYIYNQTMDCKSRVEKMGMSGIQTHQMSKKVVIKIGIISESTDNVCNLISKRKGSVKKILICISSKYYFSIIFIRCIRYRGL